MERIDPAQIPEGTVVVAADGEMLGEVHLIEPHFLLVDQPGDPHASLEVPIRAIQRYDGRLYLSVNRTALTVVDHDESASHRMGEED
jgi:hypothetical protein